MFRERKYKKMAMTDLLTKRSQHASCMGYYEDENNRNSTTDIPIEIFNMKNKEHKRQIKKILREIEIRRKA